jgi:hypothetical protein
MTYVVVNHTTIWSRQRGSLIYNYICHILQKYKGPSCSWTYGGVIYNYICHVLLKYKRPYHMITTTTARCISVIYDICSCKSHHHMITTTTASCISVIHDICSCKSHHHMITTYVMYYWNTRGRRDRDHMVVLFTTTYVMYYWNTRGRRGRDHMVVWFTTISVIHDICSCKSHHHMFRNTTAPCISVIYDFVLVSLAKLTPSMPVFGIRHREKACLLINTRMIHTHLFSINMILM